MEIARLPSDDDLALIGGFITRIGAHPELDGPPYVRLERQVARQRLHYRWREWHQVSGDTEVRIPSSTSSSRSRRRNVSSDARDVG